VSTRLLALLPTLALALPLAAQSVSPPIVEYRGEKARGSFTVTNNTLYPLTVVLTPKGFHVNEDGELADVPLDTVRIKLKLSALSFRLQPRQAQTVFYEATTDSVPSWFTIWSGITGAKTDAGINLRIELPHVVYVNQKERLALAEVQMASARYSTTDKAITIELKNEGPGLGRALQVLATGDRSGRHEVPGFPLFPNSVRRARIPWTDSLPPARVEVQFDGFKLEARDIIVDAARDANAAP
jgi:hypothetical protein